MIYLLFQTGSQFMINSVLDKFANESIQVYIMTVFDNEIPSCVYTEDNIVLYFISLKDTPFVTILNFAKQFRELQLPYKYVQVQRENLLVNESEQINWKLLEDVSELC